MSHRLSAKQYQRRLYTAKQEECYRRSIAKPERREAEKPQREARRFQKETELLKKPPPKIGEMGKQQLINALIWEHPIVATGIQVERTPIRTISSYSRV
jgi:hypothetical protein